MFSPLLNEFKKFVKSVQGRNQYSILLILTDGTIHDMPETRNIIYKLSKKPCSIIIVGVGMADFTQMEVLDGDGGSLTDCRGRRCVRDIVQFVQFNEAMQKGDLASQVLREVPSQLISYMEMNNINTVPVKQQVR